MLDDYCLSLNIRILFFGKVAIFFVLSLSNIFSMFGYKNIFLFLQIIRSLGLNNIPMTTS